MENKLALDIIGLYENNIVNLFSINQIASHLGKTYPYINKKVTKMLEEGILKKTVVGKSYLCSLNLENEQTLYMLGLLQSMKKKSFPQLNSVNRFIEKNMFEVTIHSIVKHKKTLVFIIDDLKDRRKIERTFETAKVIDREEFLDALADSSIFSDHTVLYGFERFMELMKVELDELKRLYSPLRY